MERKDGGPAYPVVQAYSDGEGAMRENIYFGLSIRDYFAGQALAGLLVNDMSPAYTINEAAEDAYKYADAMLAQRDR